MIDLSERQRDKKDEYMQQCRCTVTSSQDREAAGSSPAPVFVPGSSMAERQRTVIAHSLHGKSFLQSVPHESS